MNGPDRIWAWPWEVNPRMGQWSAEREIVGEGHEYIRRDPAVIAALPEVQAIVAAAFDRAARMCWAQVKRREDQIKGAEKGVQRERWVAGRIQAEELAKAIEALTPADASAALEAIVADAVEAEREACAKEADKRGWPGSMTVDQYASISNALEAEMDCGTEIANAIRKRGEGEV